MTKTHSYSFPVGLKSLVMPRKKIPAFFDSWNHLNLNLRFRSLARTSYASPAPDTTNLRSEQPTSHIEGDILCGYSLGTVPSGMDSHIFQQICAEHSAVYSR